MQASMRYAKANNHKVPDYDETKEKSWLIYQDCKYIYFFKLYSFLTLYSLQVTTSMGGLWDSTCPLEVLSGLNQH